MENSRNFVIDFGMWQKFLKVLWVPGIACIFENINSIETKFSKNLAHMLTTNFNANKRFMWHEINFLICGLKTLF